MTTTDTIEASLAGVPGAPASSASTPESAAPTIRGWEAPDPTMKDRAPMFHTTDKSAHIEKITDYVDPKGEKAIGLQLEFSITMSPESLDLFVAGLCAAFYRDPDMIDAQTSKGGKVRRFDLFDRIAAKQKIVGATIVLSTPRDLLNQATATRLTDATVDRIKINLMKLAIEIRGRMLIWPDAAGISAIYAMRKQAILLTITPPQAEGYQEDPDNDGDADDDGDGQTELLGDDEDPDDDPDHDGPTTSDDAPLPASAVAADPLDPSSQPASTVPVTRRRRRKVDQVFDGAVNGAGSHAEAIAGLR